MIRGINVNIHDLLKKSIELGASDIHITINSTPIARVKGSFVNLSKVWNNTTINKILITNTIYNHNFNNRLSYNIHIWYNDT